MRRKLGQAVVLLLVAIACGKNEYEYNGECVVDIKPITPDPVKPSDEKPPEDKMPSYQREGITVIDAPNMATQDAKDDQEKLDADKEGKQRAGIKPK